MSLNPTGTSYYWNHTKPDKPDFSLETFGKILALQEVQKRDYVQGSNQPGQPKFWPQGDPVLDVRMWFATQDGSIKNIRFAKAGKKQQAGEKPSLHMQLYQLSGGAMTNLIGKTVHIVTWTEHPGEHPLLGYRVDNEGRAWPCPWNTDQLKGRPWGIGNPRLYGVELVDDMGIEPNMPLPDEANVPVLLCNDAASGGQPTPPAPQQMQQYQASAMPMQGQYFAPPVTRPVQYPQYHQQYLQQQMPLQQPVYQIPQQYPQVPQQPASAIQQMPPQSAPMPQGMDPAVAQAMQAVGAQNVQPVGDSYSIYDDDIPFD